MPDHVLKLVRNTAGRDALTMIYAAALVKEPAIADGL